LKTESEIKLRAASPEAARAAVGCLGAVLVERRHFEDNLVMDDGASSIVASGRLLRLRRTPSRSVLTLKGAVRIDEGIRSRPELEVDVSDGAAIRHILEALGLRVRFRYQKYREAYAWQGLEIVVDETPVGTFLEIEGELSAIHSAAEALGYGPADYVTDSYAALFFAAGGTGDMVFSERPE
jgi:adenylate cyclase class 2